MASRSGGPWSFRGCTCCDDTLMLGGSTLSRRGLLSGGAAAIGALAFNAVAAKSSLAQSPAKPRIIDIHHHLAPPVYKDDLTRRKIDQRPMIEWTPEKSLADMDAAGVATAMMSITDPGVWFGDEAGVVSLARACNEWNAKLAADSQGRFGAFACLPLPDVEGSLREIEYALDTLKCDGFGLMTSYGNKWLGDAAFAPVMDELNRRKAVVFTHPLQPDCCRNLIAEVPRSVVEFGTDTTRTIASLLFTGTASRCLDIKFIFSHGGGTMPFLIERFMRLPKTSKEAAAKVPEGVMTLLRRFYYDTAQIANAPAMAALTKVVPTTQILFGTDFPFRASLEYTDALPQIFTEAELRLIESDNARALLPRLKSGRFEM
jgi:predicted TIM-barrel fold metal-dependent hydrolase